MRVPWANDADTSEHGEQRDHLLDDLVEELREIRDGDDVDVLVGLQELVEGTVDDQVRPAGNVLEVHGIVLSRNCGMRNMLRELREVTPTIPIHNFGKQQDRSINKSTETRLVVWRQHNVDVSKVSSENF